MAKSDQPKRPMTQAQLEVLARSNPLVAKRMKEGYYKDRLTGSAPAPARKRRAQPARLPGNTGSTPGTSRSTSGTNRASTRKKPASTGRTPGTSRKPSRTTPAQPSEPSRSGGFWKGLLGGG